MLFLVGGLVITNTFVEESNTDTAIVIAVTDGDTIRANFVGGSDKPVRLIGINAPELSECLGTEATNVLIQLVLGKEVTLVDDMTDVDGFARLLRYVYLADGTLVNEVMVHRGLALASEFPPNTNQSESLEKAQMRAQGAGLGIWADNACGIPSEANLVITHVEYDAPGNDNDNLNGEWVDIENVGPTAGDLTGWVIRDESSSHRYTFPEGHVLDAGARVRVLTGCGPDIANPLSSEVHWCEGGAVWNNFGDTAFLLDPKGNIHDEWGY